MAVTKAISSLRQELFGFVHLKAERDAISVVAFLETLETRDRWAAR